MDNKNTIVIDKLLHPFRCFHFACFRNLFGMIAVALLFSQCQGLTDGEKVSPAPNAPAPVESLTAIQGDGQIELSWEKPETTFETVRIYQKTGRKPFGPEDPGLELIFEGRNSTSLEADRLSNGTPYHFAAFTVGEDGEYSAMQSVSETPEEAAPPDPVSGLNPSRSKGRVRLDWNNPDSYFERVEIFYKKGTPVSGADDSNATQVNAYRSESYAAVGLDETEEYHFSVYTYKKNGGYSEGLTLVAKAKEGFAIPDTGQHFDATDTFGEDSDYANTPNGRSYRDNLDGTISDNVTGLMWEQLPNPEDHVEANWENAKVECQKRTTGLYEDWRLPSISELTTLTDLGGRSPAINPMFFPNTRRASYWSSTADAGYFPSAYAGYFPSAYAGDSVSAWYVNFYFGHANSDYRVYEYHVRCVR